MVSDNQKLLLAALSIDRENYEPTHLAKQTTEQE